ncbi:MAG: DUF6526 family protein [Gemmatimonadota bacterium]
MSQSFESHTRWNIPFHFIASPLLLANVYLHARDLVRVPSASTAWGTALAFAIWLGIALGRSQAVTVQDRLIRLEERLRLQRLLPPEDQSGIAALDRRQLIALRFASDDELPALYRRVRNGEFANPKEIKRAITTWRPDTLRV